MSYLVAPCSTLSNQTINLKTAVAQENGFGIETFTGDDSGHDLVEHSSIACL